MVMLNDDGDIVRAIGFIAIRFADLEDMIDITLNERLDGLVEVPKQVRMTYQFKPKVKFLKKHLLPLFDEVPDYELKAKDRLETQKILKNCLCCAVERNNALHSLLLDDMRSSAVTQFSRKYGSRPITSGEMYEIANQIWDTGGALWNMRFALARLRDASRTDH